MRAFDTGSESELRPRLDTRGGLPGLLDALAGLHARDEIGVLGIVFATAGSTYQKPGALVLLGASGMLQGAISGGCLEPELEERARTVHSKRRADTIDFDTRSDEDLIFGSGTGCRGRIHLLLLPQGPGAPLTVALQKLASEAGILEVGLNIEGSDPGAGYACLRGETWHWDGDGQAALRVAGSKPNSDVVLRITAPLKILLFGAGPETSPLHLFIRRIGWTLQVVEHRGRWLKFAQAASVQQI